MLETEWGEVADDLSLLDDPAERRRGLQRHLPRSPITTGHILAGLRLAALAVILLVGALLLAITTALKAEHWRLACVRACYKLICRTLGLRVIVHGAPTEAAPALYISNHLSYFDIMVLGSLLPASFISRGDIANWPVIGILARLQRTVFTARSRATATAESQTIRTRLEAGDRLIMFPEGTSSNGQHLLPFKSTFFAVAAPVTHGGTERPVTVQPVSMAVMELGDLPIGRHQRPLFAWYGDMEFAPHFWTALQQAGFTVEVRFHAPTTLAAAGDRKALARYCEEAIAAGFDLSLSGRKVPEIAPAAGPSALQPPAAV